MRRAGRIEKVEQLLLDLLRRGGRTQATPCGRGAVSVGLRRPSVPHVGYPDHQPLGLESVERGRDDGLVDLDECGQFELGHRRGQQRDQNEVLFDVDAKPSRERPFYADRIRATHDSAAN